MIHSRATGGHFAFVFGYPLNDNSVGTSNLIVGNRKLSLSYWVLLKAISLMPWISYFPTKNVLHDKNRRFSKRDFSAVGFLDLLKTFKTQRQKSLIFTGKAMYFYGLICKLMKNCSAALRKANFFFLREVYLIVQCLMLNWSRRQALIYATKQEIYRVFLTHFFESFRGKYI